VDPYGSLGTIQVRVDGTALAVDAPALGLARAAMTQTALEEWTLPAAPSTNGHAVTVTFFPEPGAAAGSPAKYFVTRRGIGVRAPETVPRTPGT
jgi:hypothetical protein